MVLIIPWKIIWSWYALEKWFFVVFLTMGWILEWNSGLIHFVLDHVFSWVV